MRVKEKREVRCGEVRRGAHTSSTSIHTAVRSDLTRVHQTFPLTSLLVTPLSLAGVHFVSCNDPVFSSTYTFLRPHEASDSATKEIEDRETRETRERRETRETRESSNLCSPSSFHPLFSHLLCHQINRTKI